MNGRQHFRRRRSDIYIIRGGNIRRRRRRQYFFLVDFFFNAYCRRRWRRWRNNKLLILFKTQRLLFNTILKLENNRPFSHNPLVIYRNFSYAVFSNNNRLLINMFFNINTLFLRDMFLNDNRPFLNNARIGRNDIDIVQIIKFFFPI